MPFSPVETQNATLKRRRGRERIFIIHWVQAWNSKPSWEGLELTSFQSVTSLTLRQMLNLAIENQSSIMGTRKTIYNPSSFVIWPASLPSHIPTHFSGFSFSHSLPCCCLKQARNAPASALCISGSLFLWHSSPGCSHGSQHIAFRCLPQDQLLGKAFSMCLSPHHSWIPLAPWSFFLTLIHN
jgi:hypothetical protein